MGNTSVEFIDYVVGEGTVFTILQEKRLVADPQYAVLGEGPVGDPLTENLITGEVFLWLPDNNGYFTQTDPSRSLYIDPSFLSAILV